MWWSSIRTSDAVPVTNERTIPALEAAHIRDYRDVQEHSINNGILFRAGIHKLFDTGYVTVTPDHHFEVSKRKLMEPGGEHIVVRPRRQYAVHVYARSRGASGRGAPSNGRGARSFHASNSGGRRARISSAVMP